MIIDCSRSQNYNITSHLQLIFLSHHLNVHPFYGWVLTEILWSLPRKLQRSHNLGPTILFRKKYVFGERPNSTWKLVRAVTWLQNLDRYLTLEKKAQHQLDNSNCLSSALLLQTFQITFNVGPTIRTKKLPLTRLLYGPCTLVHLSDGFHH